MIIRDISGFAKRLNEISKQPKLAKNSRKVKFKIKPSVIATYVGVFAFIIVIIFLGYQQPVKISSTSVASNSALANNVSVDDVAATSVASIVASVANLPIAPNISSLAISTKTQFQFSQANSVASAKPQIISAVVANRSIVKYTVKDGDTIDSIAVNFKISTQTIKWANNLTGDYLSTDKELRILPIDGILYTVKTGDTIDSIATKYKVDKTRLVVYNDLDVSGAVVGNEIILPGGDLPDTERPGYVAPRPVISYAGQGTGFGGSTWNIGYGTPGYAGNTYAYGNCTRYAYDRRVELGLKVSATWGNASSWAWLAALDGLLVDSNPSVGAVIQNGGGLGHVAIVEEIKPNGDLSISEMNAYLPGGGYNIVSGRIVPAGNVSSYLYIH